MVFQVDSLELFCLEERRWIDDDAVGGASEGSGWRLLPPDSWDGVDLVQSTNFALNQIRFLQSS